MQKDFCMAPDSCIHPKCDCEQPREQRPEARVVELEAKNARLAAECAALRGALERLADEIAEVADDSYVSEDYEYTNHFGRFEKAARQALSSGAGERVLAVVEAAREANIKPEGDYYAGLRCGVEDRTIYDRYDAAEYGWDQAFEYINSILESPLAALHGSEDDGA